MTGCVSALTAFDNTKRAHASIDRCPRAQPRFLERRRGHESKRNLQLSDILLLYVNAIRYDQYTSMYVYEPLWVC